MPKKTKKHKEYTEAVENFHTVVPPCTAEEEAEWQAVIRTPHVQQALRRMAKSVKNRGKIHS